jgi:hypothetical protein
MLLEGLRQEDQIVLLLGEFVTDGSEEHLPQGRKGHKRRMPVNIIIKHEKNEIKSIDLSVRGII